MRIKLFLPFVCLLPIAPTLLHGCARPKANANNLPIEADGGTVINRYHVPPLPAWERQTTPPATTNIQSVTYRREVEGTVILMKFVLFNTPESKVDSVEKLRADAAEAEKYSREEKQNLRVLESAPTSYRGLPAYMVRQLLLRGGKATESKILRVADGKGSFFFSQALTASGTSAQAISPQARAEAEAAWTTLTEGLKAVPDNSQDK